MASSPVEIVSAIGTLLSGVAVIAGVYVAYKVHQNQKLLSQQLLLPLWRYMSILSKIDPKKPITPDVVKVTKHARIGSPLLRGRNDR